MMFPNVLLAGVNKVLMYQDGPSSPETKNTHLMMSCLQKDTTSKAFIVLRAD